MSITRSRVDVYDVLLGLTTGKALQPTNNTVSRCSKFPFGPATTNIKRRQRMTLDQNKKIKSSPAMSREECVVRHTHGSE